MPRLQIIKGEQKLTACGWLRKDHVEIDGVRLKGYIQVRKKRNRMTAVTVFGQQRQNGNDVKWLAQKNGIDY